MEDNRSPMEIFLFSTVILACVVLSFASRGGRIMVIGTLLAAMVALSLYRDARTEQDPDPENRVPRYTPILSIFYLFFLAAIPILGRPLMGRSQLLWGDTLAEIGSVLLTASLYYILLALFLPLLRKHFTARTCAGFWLLPALLIYTLMGLPLRRRPLLVLDLPKHLLPLFLTLWLGGAAVLMAWAILSHLYVRHRLLKGAQRVEDPATLAVWEQICTQARQKKQPPIYRSSRTRTPLSIGLFSFTVRVVLPEQDYAPEDLALVLKHELVHIMRQDSQTKFFLTLLRALCWFNPLMWLAMRKSADDMELSCDETVLLDTDQAQRDRYAALLLHTAGDQRGFTTCLSASAAALRYRMRAVVAPTRRKVGGLLAGVLVLGLFSLSGTVTVSPRQGTAEELTMPQGVEDYRLSGAFDLRTQDYYGDVDGEALLAYLGTLPLRQIPGQYLLTPSGRSYEPNGHYLEFKIYNQEGLRYFKLSAQGLHVCRSNYAEDPRDESYLLDTAPDWDHIRALLGEAN